MKVRPYRCLLRAFCLLLVLFAALPLGAVRAPTVPLSERSFGSGGLRPSPVDLSHLAAACRARSPSGARRLLSASSLPSRWDAREHGLVTSVKSQGAYGTCWAFATAAALETALKKNGETDGGADFDLSENHLAAHAVGFDFGFDDGGNNQLAAALLTAWRDPVHERDDPYPKPSSTTNPPPVRHVQDIVWLPEGDPYNSDEVKLEIGRTYKQAVVDYGSAAVGYFHAASCYDAAKGTHYLPDWDTFVYDRRTDGGHAVTLIGWDDDYSAANFRERPPGDGAFLCKNSWGASSGTNGCIWISYYDDALFNQAGASYPAPESVANYGRVYQHDPCGQTTAWNVYESVEDETRGGKEEWCANVFTSSLTGVVEAVGFYAMSPGTEYALKVYTGCADSPVSGKLAVEQSGRIEQAGFATVKLAAGVAVRRPNERFSVVLRLAAPGTKYPIPVEASLDGWCTCSAGLGESYLSPDGVNWTDFLLFPSATRTENVCIKAYTRYGSDGDGAELIDSSSPKAKSLSARCGETVSFAVEAVDPKVGEPLVVTWTVGGRTCGTGDRFDFVTTAADHGIVEVVARATCGGYESVRRWTLILSTELFVDAAGSGDFATIQAALAGAVPGDVITVLPGVYRGTVTPSVAVEIRSRDGFATTVIDNGDGAYGTCCYNGSYAASAVLRGFTLRGGSCYNGGGAYCGTLSHCVITACSANLGSAAYGAVLSHCTVVGNTAWFGRGVTSVCSVTDSIVWDNAYYYDGWYAEPDSVAYDPLFMDADGGDYRLASGSRALNAASDGTNLGAWQGKGVVSHTITVETTGGGKVSPGTVTVEAGESVAFVAGKDHPFLGFSTNGVAVADADGVFVWEDVSGDGTLKAAFVPMDFYVDAAGGDDSNTGWFPEDAKRTLQAAADAVGSGETIYVASGRYGAVVIRAEDVTVVSVGGADPPTVEDAVGGDFIGCIVGTVRRSALHSCVTLGQAEDCDLYNCTVGGLCVGCHLANCLPASAVGSDYRLNPGSSAVDGGNNMYVTTETDLYGEPRISGARVDLGACERDLRNVGWIDPGVKVGDDAKTEAAKVRAALKVQGFAASVCDAVTALRNYASLGAWANEKGVGRGAVASSSTPLLAAALGSETLREWRSEEVKVGGFERTPEGELKGTLPLAGYDQGKVNAALLKAAVGVIGATSLAEAFTDDGLEVTVTPGPAAVEFTVRPAESASARFLRVVVR